MLEFVSVPVLQMLQVTAVFTEYRGLELKFKFCCLQPHLVSPKMCKSFKIFKS